MKRAGRPRQGGGSHYLVAMRAALVALAFSAFSMGGARADECDALAARVVSKFGASVERRSEADYIIMQQPKVRSLGISCWRESSPLTVFLSVGTAYPKSEFYDLAAEIASEAIGVGTKPIQAAARKCQQQALRSKDETSKSTRGGVFVECQAFTRDGGDTSLTIGKAN